MFGPIQADKYSNGLHNCLQLLANNPNLGRSCGEIKAGYQRHEYQSHIIFYRQREHDVFIIRILYKGMDLKRHL